MGLETFNKQEKPEEEKKLEVVKTEASTLDELVSYFLKTKNILQTSPTFFRESQIFLQSYKLYPTQINAFKDKIREFRLEWYERGPLGTFLSAMIQTSYSQGSNNFEFEKIYASHFGSFLKGKKENPIKIKAKTIAGWEICSKAENCFLEVDRLEGEFAFLDTSYCTLKIKNYVGDRFGFGMKNCKIYSPNKETLKKLKETAKTQTNRFIHTTS